MSAAIPARCKNPRTKTERCKLAEVPPEAVLTELRLEAGARWHQQGIGAAALVAGHDNAATIAGRGVQNVPQLGLIDQRNISRQNQDPLSAERPRRIQPRRDAAVQTRHLRVRR